MEQADLTVDEKLQSVTVIIPPSWQYPDITCGRIKLSDKEFKTSNFMLTVWKQSDVIMVYGKKSGTIEVYYLEEMPESDEGPFLREERNLIHVIAERLGHIIEHRITQDRLQSLYEEEKRLRERIQAEMQRRIDFTRNLIHELKTPLTALLATSQLLHEEEQDERLRKLTQYVWEGANSLNARIDDLHDVVKGEIGTLKLELKPCDISELLSSIISETQALAHQYGVTMSLKLAEPSPIVTTDGARIRQVVLNLLNNVFRYASNGGKVAIICTLKDRFLQVEVKDRGPGIQPEDHQHLFKPGYQVVQRSERAGGLGIGLALCKLLIELQGGRIWVKSKVGKGTSFFFTLPLQSEK